MRERIILISAIGFLSCFLGLLGFYLGLAYLLSYPTGQDKQILQGLQIATIVIIPVAIALAAFKQRRLAFLAAGLQAIFVLSLFVFGSFVYPHNKEQRKREYTIAANERILANAKEKILCADDSVLVLTKRSKTSNLKQLQRIVLIPKDRSVRHRDLDLLRNEEFLPTIFNDEKLRALVATCKEGDIRYEQLVEALKK